MTHVSVNNTVWNDPNIGHPVWSNGTGGWNFGTDTINPLKNLSYSVYFSIDEKDNLLSSNISGIEENMFLFNCYLINNRIQPYEYIMKLIKKGEKFSAKIKVSDILTINYVGCEFVKIKNNLTFNGVDCNFSLLKVEFKYDDILYENHNLSEKQKRADKLKTILENEGNNN